MVEKKKAAGHEKGGTKMEWQIALALAVAAPIILLPVALVTYLDLGALRSAIKEIVRQEADTRGETR